MAPIIDEEILHRREFEKWISEVRERFGRLLKKAKNPAHSKELKKIEHEIDHLLREYEKQHAYDFPVISPSR